jgi:hypothetical protein
MYLKRFATDFTGPYVLLSFTGRMCFERFVAGLISCSLGLMCFDRPQPVCPLNVFAATLIAAD